MINICNNGIIYMTPLKASSAISLNFRTQTRS